MNSEHTCTARLLQLLMSEEDLTNRLKTPHARLARGPDCRHGDVDTLSIIAIPDKTLHIIYLKRICRELAEGCELFISVFRVTGNLAKFEKMIMTSQSYSSMN